MGAANALLVQGVTQGCDGRRSRPLAEDISAPRLEGLGLRSRRMQRFCITSTLLQGAYPSFL
jgi:hypothetical protein